MPSRPVVVRSCAAVVASVLFFSTSGAPLRAQPVGVTSGRSFASSHSGSNYLRDTYQLVEPSGVVTGELYFAGNQMILDDANGTKYVLRRDRQFDSLDGRYAGYFLSSLNRVVRFPCTGTGLMRVADLDDAYPTYVFSRRSVRRSARRRNRGPIVPQTISRFGPPNFPVYGYQSFGTGLSVGRSYPSLRPRPLYTPPLQSLTLESKVVPRESLPPVTLQLFNSASREVIVTVTDGQDPTRPRQHRIAAGGTKPVQFERDAGADYVRRVQTYAPDGSVITRDLSSPVPPEPRYELVIHEWRVQSVAIDRTGKSPNPIEDVNFQGKGIGRFTLPPGDQLRSGRLDVVRTAQRAENAGAVAPMLDDAEAPSTRPMSPLEKMLQQQRNAGR